MPVNGVALTVVKSAPALDDFHLNDLGNAKRLVARHGDDLRFCHPWGRWLVWDGARWAEDEVGEPECRLKETLDELEQEAFAKPDGGARQDLLKFVWKSGQAPRMRGALELARSEVAVTPRELDNDPLLLNVENGTIHLDHGKLGVHARNDLITKLAPVRFDEDATAPAWDAFLERVQPDAEMRAYLQRCVGYSLAGDASEQVLLIAHGAGANGKSTFIETISALLGDYGRVAPASTFLDRREGIPNDLAMLRGARFVVASEIGEGRRLNEALVKQMTGSDTISARFLRAEFFEFKPVFTPWLITNHRPEIRGTDEAIWRRIHLIPWPVTIPAGERDHELAAKLRRELPGILNWALEGYLEWRRIGLDPPEQVRAATEDYRADSDTIGNFIDDRCEVAAGASVTSTVLYNAYGYWAIENGVEKLAQKSFALRMKERGYEAGRSSTKRFWTGIRLRGEETP